MKIRKLQLKNIGVFDDEEIEFKECPAKDKAEIHIFTGENGSGKTTILQALASFFESSDGYFGENAIAIETSFHRNKTYKKFRNLEESRVVIDFYPHRYSVVAYDFNGYFYSIIKEVSPIFGIPVMIPDRNDPTKGTFYQPNLHEGRQRSFAYSGYRRIKDEPIEIGKENDRFPSEQALDFVKDENSKFNVNQWLGQNLLNNSLAQTRGKLDEAKIFDEKIKRFEKVINDIIADETKDNEIRFEMQSATKLVLIKNEQELDFDVLPDGLKSLISWIGDLLMRLDSLKWKDDTPIFDREIILFLDEIEVHLHPAWQRKVLPIVQKLFKNAQIFVSTHSPFVVNSVDDAWVYKLKVEDGKARVESVERSEDGHSYSYVLEETFDIKEEFGVGVQKDLEKFKDLRNRILALTNGNSNLGKEIQTIGKKLAKQSEELNTIVQFELRQINRRKGTKLTI